MPNQRVDHQRFVWVSESSWWRPWTWGRGHYRLKALRELIDDSIALLDSL